METASYSRSNSKKTVRTVLGLILFILMTVVIVYAGWKLSSQNSEGDTRTSASAASLGVLVPIRTDTADIYADLSSKSMVDLTVKSSSISTLKSIADDPYDIMCIGMSLAEIQSAITLTESNDVQCDYIGYNPEQSGRTPVNELNNFVATLTTAKSLADDYGAKLLVGPGYGYISEHEDLYDDAAAVVDAWLIQSQALQVDTEGERVSLPSYKAAVQRIVDMLEDGNPSIEVWVQISVTPGRAGHDEPFTALEIVNLSQQINSFVRGIRVYDRDDTLKPETLRQVVAAIDPAVPTSCSSSSDCMWCGSSCILKDTAKACITLAPPSGYSCTCVSGTCTKRIK